MPGKTPIQPAPKPHPARPRKWTPHALPVLARPSVLAVLWATLLAYGSLLPFDLQTSQLLTHPAEGLNALGQSSAYAFSRVDLVTNLLLYVPLGVMLRIALSRRGLHQGVQIGLGILVVLMLSGTLELLQTYSPSRVASWADVLANVGMGVSAVVLAPWLWAVARRGVFAVYCRLAWPIYLMRSRLRFMRRSPRVLAGLTLLNAGLLTAWYATQATGVWSEPMAASARGEVPLPFEKHFSYSYDTAAVLIGRSLLVYAALGCLLSLTMLHSRTKLPLRRIVLIVLALSLVVELYRSRAAPGGYRSDLTEPILALAAAMLMGITTYLFAHAIRRTERRREQARFPGPERRRLRYDYTDQAPS